MFRTLTISAKAKPDLKLDVQVLPPKCDDPAFVMSLNDKPGILALAMEEKEGKLEALPFIVPGARFNEKYGWDSVSSARPLWRVLIAVLHGPWSLGRRQVRHGQEHCSPLHVRDQALQQGLERQPIIREYSSTKGAPAHPLSISLDHSLPS